MSDLKSVVLRGFFGKGNLGDEALLQSIMLHLGDKFNYKISLNSPALTEYKKHAPYTTTRCIDAHDRMGASSAEVCGFFLGGGGLGLGFGYNQLIFARRMNKAIVHSGVHVRQDFFLENDPEFNKVSRDFLTLPHLTTVRDKLSLTVMKEYDIPGRWAPDWAFGLPSQAWEMALPNNYIAVTFRAHPKALELISAWLPVLRDFASELECTIVVLPFDAGDAKLAMRLGFKEEMVENLYFEPRKAKYLISQAKAVVSFGRFHPVVFGLAGHVPSFAVDYWNASVDAHKSTLILMEEGQEEGVLHVGSLEGLTAKNLFKRHEVLAHKMSSRPFQSYPGQLRILAGDIQTLLKAY